MTLKFCPTMDIQGFEKLRLAAHANITTLLINIRARTLTVGAEDLLFLKCLVLLYVSSAQPMFLIRMLVRTIKRP